jgi:CRP-like cAMP-binding protein
MNLRSLTETLRGLKFLDGLSESDLKHIATVAQPEEYPPGALIFRQGERLTRVFLIVEGNVALLMRVADQQAKRVHTVGQGELLGWSPVLGPAPMTATARAMTPVRLIALETGQVLALCYQDPRFGFTFMRQAAKALAERLNATRVELLDVCGNVLPVVAISHEGSD